MHTSGLKPSNQAPGGLFYDLLRVGVSSGHRNERIGAQWDSSVRKKLRIYTVIGEMPECTGAKRKFLAKTTIISTYRWITDSLEWVKTRRQAARTL